MPERVDRTVEHCLPCCPNCNGALNRCRQSRTRYIEDIPDNIQPIVTDALPNSTLGHHVLVLSAWLHYGIGTTLSQIVDVFGQHRQLSISPGGLLQMWYRLSELLRD